ncbi:hypothetical protein ACFXG1_09755 [Streptomyces sp. NPDC059248]|uniref:hypothetical protein n=1 Tax=Streptomyces sp. NPDC059248 TaxID=3346791 RepID=UPI0036BECBF5
MKRLLAGVTAVVATAGLGLAGSTEASAASVTSGPPPAASGPPPAGPRVAGVSGSPGASAPWVLYDRYSTMSACVSVGSKGEFHGRWRTWDCVDNRPVDVQLWVQY